MNDKKLDMTKMQKKNVKATIKSEDAVKKRTFIDILKSAFTLDVLMKKSSSGKYRNNWTAKKISGYKKNKLIRAKNKIAKKSRQQQRRKKKKFCKLIIKKAA